MSYSVLENATSARMLEERYTYAERLEAAKAAIHAEIIRLAGHADMDAPCETLPWLLDYKRPLGTPGRYALKKPRSLGYALHEAFDSEKTPTDDDALALLCRAANGEDIRADAARLLHALAWRIADYHAEVE